MRFNFLASAETAIRPITPFTRRVTSTGPFSSVNIPADALLTSNRSLIRSRRCWLLASTLFKGARSTSSTGPNFPACNNCRFPMITFSGVRSSWLTLAIRLLFAWLACSACAVAASSRCWYSFAAVKSVITEMTRSTLPSGPKMGRIDCDTHTLPPDLVVCKVSKVDDSFLRYIASRMRFRASWSPPGPAKSSITRLPKTSSIL